MTVRSFKLLPLLLLSIIGLSCSQDEGYKQFPRYETVVKTFFVNYASQLKGNEGLRFMKKKQGWWVAVVDYSKESALNRLQLFWDAKAQKFFPLDFPGVKDKEANKSECESILRQYDKIYYNICPYYGYSEWSWDVIQLLEGRELPDTTTYALARAYSDYASNMLYGHTLYGEAKQKFDLKEGMNSMSADQLEEYRRYRHLAIETFRKTEKINPAYATIVGSIGLKASHEYVTSFLDLRMYQNEEEAMKELPEGLYNEFFISMAINYLASCPKDAVLFTNGDSDTYPLLYVQAKMKVRRDVSVINLSLLNTSRYTNSLRQPMPDTEPVPMTYSPEDIAGKNLELVLLDKENKDSIDLAGVSDQLKIEAKRSGKGPNDYPFLHGTNMKLAYPGGTMRWTINNHYLLRSDIMMLDILASNRWKRPICFASTCGNEVLLGMDEYFEQAGLAQVLRPNRQNEREACLQDLYDNVMKKYNYHGLEKLFPSDLRMPANYRICGFMNLANELMDLNRKDSARDVMDVCLRVLPDKYVPFENMHWMVQHYYKLGEFKKGNELALAMINNIKKERTCSEEFDEYDKRRSKASLESLRNMAELYKQEIVLRELR